MREDLEQKLYEIAPILYQQKDLEMDKTCMCWGFSCPDTWFDLLFDLSVKLEELNNKLKEYNTEIQAAQVKEKFGTLHFYYIIFGDGLKNAKEELLLNQTIDNLIDEAELKSSQICAICGAKATKITKGWITYVCDECFNKKQGDDI